MDVHIERFLKKIPPKEMAAAAGVTYNAVMLAAERGHFTARWFNDVEIYAASKGVKTPRRIFNFTRNLGNFKSPAEQAPTPQDSEAV